MIKEEGTVLFERIEKSDRSLEGKELLNLISASTVSRQALQRLTGNMLRNVLANMEKDKEVKAKGSSVLSKRKEKYYYVQKEKKGCDFG